MLNGNCNQSAEQYPSDLNTIARDAGHAIADTSPLPRQISRRNFDGLALISTALRLVFDYLVCCVIGYINAERLKMYIRGTGRPCIGFWDVRMGILLNDDIKICMYWYVINVYYEAKNVLYVKI